MKNENFKFINDDVSMYDRTIVNLLSYKKIKKIYAQIEILSFKLEFQNNVQIFNQKSQL